jgi:hypothetical protein
MSTTNHKDTMNLTLHVVDFLGLFCDRRDASFITTGHEGHKEPRSARVTTITT